MRLLFFVMACFVSQDCSSACEKLESVCPVRIPLSIPTIKAGDVLVGKPAPAPAQAAVDDTIMALR